MSIPKAIFDFVPSEYDEDAYEYLVVDSFLVGDECWNTDGMQWDAPCEFDCQSTHKTLVRRKR